MTMPARCRVLFAGTLLFLSALFAEARGAEYSVVSRTMLHYFEQDTAEEEGATVVPGYEFLRLDARDGSIPGLSLHLYGWGRVDFADSGRYEDRTRAQLVYGYVEYKTPEGPISFKAGRTYVFQGVANESIDGVEVASDITPSWSVAAYAGQPVTLISRDGRKGDAIAGGRVAWRDRGYHQAGISYKYIASDGERDEERLGVDFALTLPGQISLLGSSNYNLVEEKFAEHLYEARWHRGNFELRPFYQRFDLEGLFSERDNSATPFRVLSEVGGRTDVLGAEAYWYPSEAVEFGARVKHYDYSKRFDNAWYLSALANYRWRIFNHVGAELGRMAGEEEFNRFSLARGYVYYTFPRSFVTGEAFYTRYDDPIFSRKDAWYLSAGVGRKFLRDALNLKLSTSYTSDPLDDRDYRTTLVAEYVFP